jgi:Family of unknown function (DUF5946)
VETGLSGRIQDLRSALLAYTSEHSDPAFIHQHVIDALGAQRADASTTPIQLTFALVGLYLHVEQAYDGRRVQRVHAALARMHPAWPTLALPEGRGEITADDVMAAPAGTERDAVIDAWCTSVWMACSPCRDAIVTFLGQHGVT